eukprot:7379687-Prymnesium_polylepis.5
MGHGMPELGGCVVSAGALMSCSSGCERVGKLMVDERANGDGRERRSAARAERLALRRRRGRAVCAPVAMMVERRGRLGDSLP